MTPQEMNLKIAEILGLNPIVVHSSVIDCSFVFRTYDGEQIGNPLDYTTDKALCWDLIEKLYANGWRLNKLLNHYVWIRNDYIYVYNESLLLATCEAIIEEFGK